MSIRRKKKPILQYLEYVAIFALCEQVWNFLL